MPSTPRLARSQKVLHRDGSMAGSHARFTREPDEPGDVATVVDLDFRDFIDMGYPQTITVTIHPGDRLNEES